MQVEMFGLIPSHKPCNKLLANVSQECHIEEIADEEEAPPKNSKDKKSNGPDKGPSLAFKLTSKVPYKTVLKGVKSIARCFSLSLSGQVYAL